MKKKIIPKFREELKLLAHKKDVPYQSLMKIFLAERVKEELVWGRVSSFYGPGEQRRI